MAYSISYKRSVQRDLASLSKAEARRILDKIEKDLTSNPDRCPPLKGPFAGLRKLRVGDYRVIFVVQQQEVLVLRIGHRRDVYDRQEAHPTHHSPRSSATRPDPDGGQTELTGTPRRGGGRHDRSTMDKRAAGPCA